MPTHLARHWKFLLLTFGCKVNQYESEALREAWLGLGGLEVETPNCADLICINSCAITAKGERDCRAAIARMKRANPKAQIILTGCAANIYPKDLKTDDPTRPTLIVEQSCKAKLLSDPWELLQVAQVETVQATLTLAANSGNYPPFRIATYQRARPVIKIQDGCTHRCTYCIVPTLRQNLASREPSEIIAEAKRLLQSGFAEIILSGINLKQYGKDAPSFGNFWALIARLEEEILPIIDHKVRIRLSSIEPSQLTPEGLEVLAQSKLICPHLHISLQHTSPSILKRMGRGHYKAEDLTRALEQISQFWPLFGLGCDIICGFPGETDADFQDLYDFCTTLPFTYAHVFPYSARPKTPAANFPNQIDYATKMGRSAKLRQLLAEKNLNFRQSLLAKQVPLHIVADTKDFATCQIQKGVSEYYVQCSFEHLEHDDHFIHTAQPQKLTNKGLSVKICD